MAIKKRPLITAFIGYVLSILIAYACHASRKASFDYISLALCVLTVILLLAIIPITFKVLRFPDNSTTLRVPTYPSSQRWFILMFNQTLLLLGGGLFFFGVALQSQISPKAQSILFDAFVPLLTIDAPLCLFLPWVIISTLSVLTNHRAQQTSSMVWLPGLTIGLAPHQPKKFFLSAYNAILNMVITTAGILLLCISIGLLCESLAQADMIPSVWQTPVRNAFFMFILLMFSYQFRDRMLKKYIRRHFSLGAIFFIEAFLIITALVGFEAILNFSEFPIQEKFLFQRFLAPMTTIDARHSLGTVFMLWPLFLIPYLVPTFARISMGLRVWQAFLMPLLIPGCLFLWLLPTHLQASDFLAFVGTLKEPVPLLFLGLSGLFVVYFLFQHVRNFFDLHVGSMPLVNPPYKNLGLYLITRPLIKGVLSWMALLFIGGWFIVHLSFYGIGVFFLFCLMISAICFLVKNLRLGCLLMPEKITFKGHPGG
jgi:hypothetical protein